MYKIDIKEALYPIQIVLVVYKKFSKTSVFIDRKWPIQRIFDPVPVPSPSKRCFLAKGILIIVSFMTDLKNALSLLSFLKSLRITYFSHLLRIIETNLNEFTQNTSNLICHKINIHSETSPRASNFDIYVALKLLLLYISVIKSQNIPIFAPGQEFRKIMF